MSYPTGVRRYKTPLESLMARRRITNGGCWEWTGVATKDLRRPNATPYGRIRVRGVTGYVHRVAYELMVGPIPDGLTIDHLCRNTLCFNPEHLEVVSHQVNILRGTGIAAQNAAKDHCDSGHPLAGHNLYEWTDSKGRVKRYCRICSRARWQEWYVRHHGHKA